MTGKSANSFKRGSIPDHGPFVGVATRDEVPAVVAPIDGAAFFVSRDHLLLGAVGDVPDSERSVETDRGELRAVRRETNLADSAGVPLQHSCFASGRHVPQADGVIVAA